MRIAFLTMASVLVLLLSGCTNTTERCGNHHRERCEPTTQSPVDPSGDAYRYVVDSIRFPTNWAEANEVGFDLDGDDVCRKDNAVGGLLQAVFGAFDSDLNSTTVGLINTGRVLQLFEVRASSLADASGVGLGVYAGIDADADPSNNLNGAGQFVIDEEFASVELAGDIVDGQLTAQLGSVPLQVAFAPDTDPVVITLNVAQVDATVTQTTIRGRLGGSFTHTQVRDELLPIAWQLMSVLVDQDCSGTVPYCCEDNSRGATVVGLFDTAPQDCRVTLDEVLESNLVKSLTAPSLDLYDDEGRHNPRCDQVKESLGFAISFTAVSAMF